MHSYHAIVLHNKKNEQLMHIIWEFIQKISFSEKNQSPKVYILYDSTYKTFMKL